MLTVVIPAMNQTDNQITESRNAKNAGLIRDRNEGFEGDDPLLASTPLPHRHVLFPYGFPMHIKSNDPTVIRSAELSWGAYRERFREVPVELRIIVSECVSRRQPRPPVFRAQANLLTLVSDANNYGCCDLSKGFGFACLTRAAVTHGDFLRYNFLEGMIYTLLDTQHLATVHAACVSLNECGVLLVGESGAGKSSLTYACARQGWTYVSDDASCLVMRRKGRTVVGNPRTFRFRPSASDLFPELHGHVKQRNGKPTLEIRTDQFPHLKLAQECEVGYVVFLNRRATQEETRGLRTVSRAECFRRLFQNPWPAELDFHEDRMAAIERLIEAPAYELSYKEFSPAIELLEGLVASTGAA
jgi:HPr Serine kinase C-terminal domain